MLEQAKLKQLKTDHGAKILGEVKVEQVGHLTRNLRRPAHPEVNFQSATGISGLRPMLGAPSGLCTLRMRWFHEKAPSGGCIGCPERRPHKHAASSCALVCRAALWWRAELRSPN